VTPVAYSLFDDLAAIQKWRSLARIAYATKTHIRSRRRTVPSPANPKSLARDSVSVESPIGDELERANDIV